MSYTLILKTNLPARIAFRLPAHHDSMTILDQAGAENLLGRGDMLFAVSGDVERLQGFYVSADDLMKQIQDICLLPDRSRHRTGGRPA